MAGACHISTCLTAYLPSIFEFITRSRLNAALMSARWLKACGEFPSCSPLRAISSENMDRWFEKLRIYFVVQRRLLVVIQHNNSNATSTATHVLE